MPDLRRTRRISRRSSITPEVAEDDSLSSSSLSSVPEVEVKPRKRVKRSTKRSGKTDAPERKQSLEDIEDLSAPPPNWQAQFEALREFRRNGPPAAVDTMGCDAHEHVDPKTKRLHCLISLMLSAQCKDEANALVMATLKATLPRGLTLPDLLEISESELALLIRPSGMHNRKAKYIKMAAEQLRDRWDSDVPDTAVGMMSLPGVGPKMAMLCMGSAWGKTVGIGVDTHVHRITNLLGWVHTNAPEKTRLVLESWLPREYWREINHMLVGHGQLTCRPIGRRCSECPLSQEGILQCPSINPAESPRKKAKKSPVKIEVKTEEESPSKTGRLDSYEARFPRPSPMMADSIETEGREVKREADLYETGTELDRLTEEKMAGLAANPETSPYFEAVIKSEA